MSNLIINKIKATRTVDQFSSHLFLTSLTIGLVIRLNLNESHFRGSYSAFFFISFSFSKGINSPRKTPICFIFPFRLHRILEENCSPQSIVNLTSSLSGQLVRCFTTL